MTENTQPSHDAPDDDSTALEPWMLALVHAPTHLPTPADAMTVDVPREMMWQRIQAQRIATASPPSAPATIGTDAGAGIRDIRTARVRAPGDRRWRNVAAIAAVLLGGVAIGRYALPVSTPPATRAPALVAGSNADSMSSPARVAMQEHLVRTVSLLTTVRDRDSRKGAEPDVTTWARELLGTTRLLLDEPSLRDDRTRHLLQDLELVLMQIIDSRGTAAPEAKRAPTETMRETNLLPRVRAVMTASLRRDEQTVYGADE